MFDEFVLQADLNTLDAIRNLKVGLEVADISFVLWAHAHREKVLSPFSQE